MIKRNPQYELRTLIFSILDGAITYDSVVVPVFEAVPKGKGRPYVVIGDCDWDNSDTKDGNEDDYVLKLEVYTDYGGTLDNCGILDELYQAIGAVHDAGNLQFIQTPTRSKFCLTMCWYRAGNTRVMRPEESSIEVDLEYSFVELICRIKQLR